MTKSRSSSIDNFKMSVDFTSFMTPSMDAAMSTMMQQQQQQVTTTGAYMMTSQDVVASTLAQQQQQQQQEEVTTNQEQEVPVGNPMMLTDNNTLVAKIVALSEKTKAADLETKKKKQKITKQKNSRTRDPDVKIYVEPLDGDVLLGRGGRSNHHAGNVAYRLEVGKLREWYRTSEKNAKTDLSQLLVDWVLKEQKGRFLKQDTTQKWYIVTNIVARRKASQALREHMTPEERDAKKKKKTKRR